MENIGFSRSKGLRKMIKHGKGIEIKAPKTWMVGGWVGHIMFPVLLVCMVGAADYMTGWEISFGLFYLIPVGIVAWFQRKLNTFIIVWMCALMWMTVDLASGHVYSKQVIIYWNTLVRLGIFAIVGIALFKIRELQIRHHDLVNYVVHDLRNPLFTIMANLEFLRDLPAVASDLQVREGVQESLIAGGRMTTLIDSILDLSQLEQGKISLNPLSVPVRELLDEALHEVSVFAKRKKVNLSSHIGEKVDSVYVDHLITLRILVNLLTNAIKASPAGSAVKLEAVQHDKHKVAFRVTDQGQGIPKQYLVDVFDKLTQIKMGQAGFTSGSGLGLAFCRLATNVQGGEIWLENEPDRGTTVTFTLPTTLK
jgi:signal transduction histidine kinase